jgi:multidrug efflux pump
MPSAVLRVGDVQLFGSQYAMRIWMDPNKLNNFQLTPVDVISAIKAQNAQVAAGQLGGTPPVKGQQLNASIIAQTRLTSADEFSKILLKVNQDGSQVRLRDVAKVELGGENYDIIAKFNGKPASGLGIKLATGANALDTATAIRGTEEDGTVLPVRSEDCLSVRHHTVRKNLDSRSG